MGFQDQNFLKRHQISENTSFSIMENLFENKHIYSFYKTEVKEDKDGTDYVVTIYDKPHVNVQFKTRHDSWKDLPVCRFQPFRGLSNSTIGRDYKSIITDKNEFYFVATQNNKKIFDCVSITSTEKIKALIEQAEKEWFANEEPYGFFTEEIYQKYLDQNIRNKKLRKATNGVEAWFKKNPFENFGKINIYIPVSYVDKIVELKWR